MTGTVRLHHVPTTNPGKVYRAFTAADAITSWLPPNGYLCTVHHLDAKVAVRLKAVSVGTELTLVQEGIPDLIRPDGCYLGWQDCLEKLARLVQPGINE